MAMTAMNKMAKARYNNKNCLQGTLYIRGQVRLL